MELKSGTKRKVCAATDVNDRISRPLRERTACSAQCTLKNRPVERRSAWISPHLRKSFNFEAVSEMLSCETCDVASVGICVLYWLLREQIQSTVKVLKTVRSDK